MVAGSRVPAAAVAAALSAVTLMVAALCISPRGSELLQTVFISGQQYALVPVISQGHKPLWNQQNQGYNMPLGNHRAHQGLFGPGDLPMPIEDDGDYTNVIPGSNVFFYEHGVPPIPQSKLRAEFHGCHALLHPCHLGVETVNALATSVQIMAVKGSCLPFHHASSCSFHVYLSRRTGSFSFGAGMDDYPDPPYSIGWASLDDPNY